MRNSRKKAGLSGLFLCGALAAISLISIAPAFAADTIAIEVAAADAAYDQRSGQPLVSFKMTEASKRIFTDFTSRNVGHKMELRVDGKVVMAPVIREPITGGTGQIADKSLTVEGAKALAERLSTGNAKIDFSIADD